MTSQIKSLFTSNKYTQIISLHKEGIEITTLSVNDQLRIAAAYFQSKDYNETLEILDLIAPYQANSTDYLNLTAISYRKLGRYDKAHDLLTEAERIDPSSIEVKSNKANVLLDLGRIDEAEKILRKIIKKNPDFEDAKTNLARANLLKEQLINTNSVNTSKSMDLGYSNDPLLFAFDAAIVDKDLERYEAIVNRSPQENAQKNKSEAGKMGEILLDTDAEINFESDKIKLSTISNQQNNIDESLELSSIVHGQEKEISSVVLANVSDSYIKKMRFKEAEIYALHSIINGNERPELYLNLSTLCTLRSDYKLASHYLNKAILMDPSHPNIEGVRIAMHDSNKANKKSIDFREDWTKEKELKSN